MNRIVATVSIAAAFAAGCGVTHVLRPAFAAETITAQIIHTQELSGDALGAANAGGMRSKMYVTADGATISIQDGNVGKHMHPNTNEIQYILEGTGTIWLGDWSRNSALCSATLASSSSIRASRVNPRAPRTKSSNSCPMKVDGGIARSRIPSDWRAPFILGHQ